MEIIIDMDNLDEAKILSDEACKRALHECAALWKSTAKTLAPVDTGRLRNSIKHKAQGKNTQVVYTDVEYAIYQEFGTSKQSGTPFLKPSGEQLVGRFKEIIESELK